MISSCERRILVLAPTGRDAALVQSVFEQVEIDSFLCEDVDHVCAELSTGAAALMVAEEALAEVRRSPLIDWLDAQPQWSDLPVLLLARQGVDAVALGSLLDERLNVTVVERPTRVAALVSVARTALRARQRQYQLRQHLAEREQVETQLRANDRRKDEFLAMLAHELRNPLAPIASSMQIFRLKGHGDPELAHIGDIFERQVNHLMRLVDDLLEVSRITRGKIELRRERVELDYVIRHALETSRPLIDAAGHRLDVELPSSPLVVDADAVRLGQVFSNLLNNAAKYTERGGSIRLRVAATEGRATVTVSDTGIGIPPSMLSAVFDMFTQVPRGPGRSEGGLGIGLTLVKSIVEMHGGSVRAASDGEGRGSSFVVTLPLAAPRPSAAAEPKAPRGGRITGRRVLIVDDNRDAARSLAQLLRLLGATADVANSGAEALSALSPGSHDLVLLDIGMPEMNGYEVARRIRSRPELAGLLIFALTGWSQQEDVRRSAEAGIDSHLVKPVDVATLDARLEALGAQ